MTAPLHGVLPVLHMPYHDNFEIDFDVLGTEVDYAYSVGADGIVLALASELLRLTSDERHKVAEFLVRQNGGRGSVTISVGAESTVTAVALARHAAGSGATAVMAIPPLSVGLGEDQLRAYYDSIIEAIDIPVVIQDASGYVGKPMSTSFQVAVRQTWGDRVLFKPESSPVGPVISALKAATHGEAVILEGSGGTMLVENYRRGIDGTMPGTDLLDVIVALWKALHAGDDDRIYALSPLLGAILALAVGLDGFLHIEKYLMVKRGIFKNELVRGPVSFSLDLPARAEIDRLFLRLQAAL